MGLYRVEAIPWYDNYEKCYYNALSINVKPDGPLGDYVRQYSTPVLSPFQVYNNGCCQEDRCKYMIVKDNCSNKPVCEQEYTWLLSFLIDNNYQIDASLTKMIKKSGFSSNSNKILCLFTYNSGS
jgi:hypothetical protein